MIDVGTLTRRESPEQVTLMYTTGDDWRLGFEQFCQSPESTSTGLITFTASSSEQPGLQFEVTSGRLAFGRAGEVHSAIANSSKPAPPPPTHVIEGTTQTRKSSNTPVIGQAVNARSGTWKETRVEVPDEKAYKRFGRRPWIGSLIHHEDVDPYDAILTALDALPGRGVSKPLSVVSGWMSAEVSHLSCLHHVLIANVLP